MKIFLSLAIAMLFDAAPSGSDDPLAAVTSDPIDIELKEAPVDDVYTLMSDIAGVTFELEPCGDQTLSLKLERAPVPVVLRVMATRLGRSYVRDGDRIVVRCEASAEPEIDATLRDFPAGAAIDLIAAQAGVTVSHRACEGVRLDLEAHRVPVSAVLWAVAAQLDATLAREDGTWILTCAPATTR